QMRNNMDDLKKELASLRLDDEPPRVDGSGGAPPGTPLLTASGYVVARRKAVVSAKIQGRLADLRIEEGARVGDLAVRRRACEVAQPPRGVIFQVNNLIPVLTAVENVGDAAAADESLEEASA